MLFLLGMTLLLALMPVFLLLVLSSSLISPRWSARQAGW